MTQMGMALFAFVAGCSPLGLFGGEVVPTEFAAVDLDRNDKVNPAEFAGWSGEQGLLQELGGEEKTIAPMDLASTLFTFWDAEGGGLTEAEWTAGLEQWFPKEDAGLFDEWDLDADGKIDDLEMQAGFAHTDLASAWDGNDDGELSDREVYNGLFEAFDENRDGSLDDTEWDAGVSLLNF